MASVCVNSYSKSYLCCNPKPGWPNSEPSSEPPASIPSLHPTFFAARKQRRTPWSVGFSYDLQGNRYTQWGDSGCKRIFPPLATKWRPAPFPALHPHCSNLWPETLPLRTLGSLQSFTMSMSKQGSRVKGGCSFTTLSVSLRKPEYESRRCLPEASHTSQRLEMKADTETSRPECTLITKPKCGSHLFRLSCF